MNLTDLSHIQNLELILKENNNTATLKKYTVND